MVYFTKNSKSVFVHNQINNSYDTLPNGWYSVIHNRDFGLYLSEITPKKLPSKLYGDCESKANLVKKVYKQRATKNTGVFLTGTHGSGKTLFSNYLASVVNNPTIVISIGVLIDYYELLSTFIPLLSDSTIIIDEFDKIDLGDNSNLISALFQLLEGSVNSHHLYIICSNSLDLPKGLYNRLGRILFKYEYSTVSLEILEEVLQDYKLSYLQDEFIKLKLLSELNLDVLLTICNLLSSMDVSLSELLDSLNLQIEDSQYSCILPFVKGLDKYYHRSLLSLIESESMTYYEYDFNFEFDTSHINYRTISDTIEVPFVYTSFDKDTGKSGEPITGVCKMSLEVVNPLTLREAL